MTAFRVAATRVSQASASRPVHNESGRCTVNYALVHLALCVCAFVCMSTEQILLMLVVSRVTKVALFDRYAKARYGGSSIVHRSGKSLVRTLV